jgi:hypothetical protein
MAQKVPNEMVPLIIKMAPQSDHNWEQYDDGAWWKLVKGDDYQVQTNSARNSAKNWAKVNGRRAEIGSLKDQDGFVLRFVNN